jgi:hypothetical protein
MAVVSKGAASRTKSQFTSIRALTDLRGPAREFVTNSEPIQVVVDRTLKSCIIGRNFLSIRSHRVICSRFRQTGNIAVQLAISSSLRRADESSLRCQLSASASGDLWRWNGTDKTVEWMGDDLEDYRQLHVPDSRSPGLESIANL